MKESLPNAGNVYSFRTTPLSEFAQRTVDRYAALKVLGSNRSLVVIAVLNSVWLSPPSLGNTRTCEILREHRFRFTGRLAVFGIDASWWATSELDRMELLGSIPLSAEETMHASDVFNHVAGSSYSTMSAANSSAEGEWRWANDREALVSEQHEAAAKQAAKLAAQRERYESRLRGLTWDKMLAEIPFERWSPTPPFPPEDFTREARSVVHQTCQRLRALGKKPKKVDVRALLKECVEWFNKADACAGGVIETEEREDIFAIFQEMAFVARQETLVDEIDNWRTW